MEYSEFTLKKIRKPELIEILEKSGYSVNKKMKVDDLKKIILEKKIKIKITQEEFENKCVGRSNKSDSEIEKIIEKNQKKLYESKKIIDLSDSKNNKIKYVIILPYSENLSDDAKVFTFKFKKDFDKDIVRFWGIPKESEFIQKTEYTKYESTIEGFSWMWCNDIPAHLGCCKWDDTPAIDFKPMAWIGLLCHGRAYLVR